MDRQKIRMKMESHRLPNRHRMELVRTPMILTHIAWEVGILCMEIMR